MPANVGGLSFAGEQVVNAGLNPCCWQVAGLFELVRRFARRMMGNHSGRPSLDQCFLHARASQRCGGERDASRAEGGGGQGTSLLHRTPGTSVHDGNVNFPFCSVGELWVPGTQPRTAGVNPRIGLESLGRWTPSWIFNTCASSTYPSLFSSFFPSQQANFKLQSQL